MSQQPIQFGRERIHFGRVSDSSWFTRRYGLSLSSAGKSLGLSPKPQVNQLLFNPLLRPFPVSYLVYRFSVTRHTSFSFLIGLCPVAPPLSFPKNYGFPLGRVAVTQG